MAIRAISVPATRSGIRPLRRSLERFAMPLVGFAVLVSAVAVPLATSRSAEPAAPPLAARPLPASSIVHLDRLPGLASRLRPKSDAPAGGMVFVRCTNLWTALPDGTNPRRLLSMAGLSSPTFSPGARTVAFLGRGPEGQEIWMAAADGSATTLVGAIQSGGAPPAAIATGLTWSPQGDRLAFALLSPVDLPSSGSSIWTLDIATGRIERVGTGWPAPTWIGKSLIVAKTGPQGRHFHALWGRNWAGKELTSGDEDFAAAVSPGWWAYLWQKDAAIVRAGDDGKVELAVRSGIGRKDARVTTPPEGYAISTTALPAVLQNGPVAVTLIGPDGGRDLGLVDPRTGTWTLIDYAWDAVWSPAPPAIGRLAAQRAAGVSRELLSAWERRPGNARLILGRRVYHPLAPFDAMGYTFGRPTRMHGGWSVPATVFGRTKAGFAFRRLAIAVRADGGRLFADPIPTSSIEPIRTIEQAVAFLRSILSAHVLPAAGLPEGTRLAPDAVSAWSWGAETTGQLNLRVPGSSGGRRFGSLTINFGDAGFGCVAPEPIELSTGTPALATDYGQVAWPAGPKASSAPYGIYSDLPREEVLRIAAAMDAERLAGPSG